LPDADQKDNRMNTTRALFAAIMTAVLAIPTSMPAQQATQLSVGGVTARTMSAGQVHAYMIDLDDGQFFYARVDQQGIDVAIDVAGPDGESIGEFDSPNGRFGPEVIVFTTQVGGEYVLEVQPFNEDTDPGEYTISVLRVSAAATTPEGQVGELFTPWDNDDGPGAAIAVARNGTIVYENGFGVANLEYGIPITPRTIFHVASVSKQFTAFSIALLADRGELSLDDDIREYLPEVPDFGEEITIRHLIHHTSGLRDQWALLGMAGWRLDDVITTDHILGLVARQEALNFEPGAEYLYSNTGYTLLAEIVARVSGQSFPEWTWENIFEPLGMIRTHFHDDHEMIVPDRAYSYQSDPDGGFRKSVLSYANAGATSLFTTVEDLTLWNRNLDTGDLGGRELIEQMHQRGVLNDGDTLSYAFALVVGDHEGIRTVSHGGGDAGFRSTVNRFPDQALSVVILSNEASFNPSGMALQVADIYLAEEIERLATASEDISEADDAAAGAAAVGERVAIEMDPEVFGDYEGDYRLAAGFILAVFRNGDELFVHPTGQDDLQLFPESEDEFFLTVVDARISFVRDDSGSVTGLVLHQGDRDREADRIEPYDPSSDQLIAYEGDYWSTELATGYRIVLEEGGLVAYHQRHPPIPLEAVSPDEFTGETWFFTEIQFDRAEDDQVSGMRVTNGRVRNLWFERR
jgi:CubicO group peptidase (beta-lactamase class C family)